MSDRKTPGVPDLQGIDGPVARVLSPLREIVLRLTGRTGGQVARLGGTATTQEIQNKVNEIIDRMNA
jgi:hypothetical protein